MREILFRGKRVRGGEWGFGSFVSPNRIAVRIGEEVYASDIVSPETVGEYTGLTDKNGKKIFEGDIVKEWSAWWRTPNEIRCNTFEVVCKHLGTLLLIRKNRGGEESKTLNRNSTVEVIGNVYDTPELLEVEK